MASRRYSRDDRKKKFEKNKILIVCGGNTEKIYFENHRANLKNIKVIPHKEDSDPMNIVNKAIKLREKDDYIEVWCVFDRDEFDRFDEAISFAKKKNIRCAFSNESFEVWYLLHYKYFENYKNRRDCIKELEKQLGKKYDKVDKGIYDVLESRLDIAIQNAKKSHQIFMSKGGNPSTWCSCTTVYQLIETLNKWKQ